MVSRPVRLQDSVQYFNYDNSERGANPVGTVLYVL